MSGLNTQQLKFMTLSFLLFYKAFELFIAQNPSLFTMTMGALVIADPDGKDGQIYCSSESCECADFQAGRYCWHRVAFAIMASQTQG